MREHAKIVGVLNTMDIRKEIQPLPTIPPLQQDATRCAADQLLVILKGVDRATAAANVAGVAALVVVEDAEAAGVEDAELKREDMPSSDPTFLAHQDMPLQMAGIGQQPILLPMLVLMHVGQEAVLITIIILLAKVPLRQF